MDSRSTLCCGKGKFRNTCICIADLQAMCGWQPRYVLTDDSAVEQLTVRRALPGLQAGEQEVGGHLLCTVHTMRTLNKRFKATEHKPIFNALRQAMFTLQVSNAWNYVLKL